MQEIPLLVIPNQSMTVDLETKQFDIRIKEADGCMVADVSIDGEAIVTGQRIVAGEPIIPYFYLQNGNLIVSTLNDELPCWEEFGSSQALLYLTDAEMADG